MSSFHFRRSLPAALLLALASSLSAATPAKAPSSKAFPLTPILLADFELQPVDQPIGTGGAALGQPVSGSMANQVIAAGIDGQSVRVMDSSSVSAVNMRFQFIDSLEMDQGRLWITAQLRTEVPDSFFITVREHHSSSRSFTNISFTAEGGIWIGDAAGNAGMVGPAGSVKPDVIHRIDIEHDLDTGTYSVFLDGEALLIDRAHGLTIRGEAGRGIGAVLFGYNFDADTSGVMLIDNIEVQTDALAPVRDPFVFRSGFEAPMVRE
jgi:hypothetical protein